MLEQTGGFIPVTQVLEQFAQCDEVQPMLYASLVGILHNLIDVRQQRCHRDYIHGIMVEHAR